jgi:hypothetical protein
MQLLNISNRGLCILAILVGALWGFILTNRFIVHRAEAESFGVPRKLKHLKSPRSRRPAKAQGDRSLTRECSPYQSNPFRREYSVVTKTSSIALFAREGAEGVVGFAKRS